MSAQSYLIIGGCGFVGWNIALALLARGERAVAVFDIVRRQEDKRVQFFTGDICDQQALEDAIRKVRRACFVAQRTVLTLCG